MALLLPGSRIVGGMCFTAQNMRFDHAQLGVAAGSQHKRFNALYHLHSDFNTAVTFNARF